MRQHHAIHRLLAAVCLIVCCALTAPALAAGPVQIDIYGPGQGSLNLALADPLGPTPGTPVTGQGAKLNEIIRENLSFLPFLRLTDPKAILGG